MNTINIETAKAHELVDFYNLSGHRIKSTSRLYLDIRHQAKLTAQSSNCAKGWQWLSCKRAMMTSADIQSIQHGVSCITNPASAACRTLQRFIMNHPRRTVGRQHDIKLNSPNTQGCADAQPGQRILWRQRTAAAMRKNARETPAGCRIHYLLLLLLLLPLAFAATGCGCMTALPR